MAVVLGLLGTVLALAFPFLPVVQDTATITWPSPTTGTRSVDAPLVAFRPESMSVSIPCQAVRSLDARTPTRATVFSTTPPLSCSGAGRDSLRGPSRRRQGARNQSLAQLAATRSSQARACARSAKSGPARSRRTKTSCMMSSASARLRYRSGTPWLRIVHRRAFTTNSCAPGRASSAVSTSVCTSAANPVASSSSTRHAVVAGKSCVRPPESTTARTGPLPSSGS